MRRGQVEGMDKDILDNKTSSQTDLNSNAIPGRMQDRKNF